MRTAISATILFLLACSAANAQKIAAAPAHFSTPPRLSNPGFTTFNSFFGTGGSIPNPRSFHHFHHRGSFPFFLDSLGLFPDYADNSAPVPGTSAGNAELLLQALSALNSRQEPPKADSQSILIELQGDRYVSLTSAAQPVNVQESIVPQARAGLTKRSEHQFQKQHVAELAPVTLLFRDGHSESVHDYTIANGVIYVRGDLNRDGYMSKRIDLSSLDLRETLITNEDRGVHFIVPNSTNEVVTRP